MKYSAIIAGLAGTAALVATLSAHSAEPYKDPPAWLSELAESTAASRGDTSPTSAEWTLASQDNIAPIVGTTGGDSKTFEYIVILQGEFTNTGGFFPPGFDPPKGSSLVFTVDPESQVIQDLGVLAKPPDTSGLNNLAAFTPAAQQS